MNRSIMIWVIAALTGLSGCDGGQNPNVQRFDDSPTEGTIHISVDESFKPVIDSQIQVFESQFPKAHIIAEYKSEADCIKDLDKDSTRMIIVTRGLSDKESDYFKNKMGFKPRWDKVAYDAITLVLNKKAKDSLYSLFDVKRMLDTSGTYKFKVVMDGLNATSTVRFALDSILRGAPMGKQVQAAKNSEAVIDYVASDVNAVGLIGISWLGNKDDADQLTFSDKVKIAAMRCINCDSPAYIYPYQANIAMARYPMPRALYYILKENGSGLGSGFVNFLVNPARGQLIFKRAYLLPAKLSYEVRKMSVEEEAK